MANLKSSATVTKSRQGEYASNRFDRFFTIKPTARVNRLREALLSLKPTASINRARIETRVMKETAGQPLITRRAKIFAALASEMPVEIYPDELVVGCYATRPLCNEVNPGTDLNAYGRGVFLLGYRADTVSTELSEADRRELDEELTPYWREQGRPPRITHYGHNVLNWEKVLKKGFLGIKREAEERLARLDPANPDNIKRIRFLEGIIIAMQAAAEIGKKYADRARELADQEKDAARKAELLKIAEVCDWVPANPARTFWEALQSFYFAWMMVRWEDWSSMGRVDQYFYPYYERDIAEGRLTKEEAQELIDCFLIKANQGEGIQQTHTVAVGGFKADGSDATNELSYMFIEGMMHTRLPNWFAVMIHSKTTDDLLIKACQLCAMGTGHPQFLNMDVGVAQMLARGNMGGPMVTLEDARDSANVGCLELVVPGKDSGYLYTGGQNLALALELALNNGEPRLVQEQTGAGRFSSSRRYSDTEGVPTGDPGQFKSFDEVKEAFRRQVVEIVRKSQIGGIIYEQTLIDFYPVVYVSALIDDCIEKGICREEGGAHYNFNTGTTEVGSSDVADSLAAIKKLVFDEKRITMAQLCEALDHNFDGYEDIRKMCLEAPKFGNDDNYVDELKAWVIHVWASEFMKVKNLRGGYGCPGGSSMTGYISGGKIVGTLPSGRLAGEPLAPAGSPCIGKDRNGITSVLKSMGKVDGIEVLGGLSLTARIDPTVFQKRDGIKRMADLMRTFVDQKVFHIQFNVTSSDTLKAAQKDPEEYRDLMVKVAGWNAYFTQLTKEVQDSIIARTEHGL